MSIVITPSVPVAATQGATADVVLQAGSVVSARVLQVLGDDQVQIAIGGQSIDVLSQVPLQPGQILQLAVSLTPDGVRLAIVNADASASASEALAGLAGATAALDVLTLAPEAIASIAAQTTLRDRSREKSAHAAGGGCGIGRGPDRGGAADQSGAAVCQSRRRFRAGQPAAAGAAGGGAGAGAAHQPRSRPERQRHQAGLPEFGAVPGGLAGGGIGCAIVRRAGSQGGADRAAPGADDIAR